MLSNILHESGISMGSDLLGASPSNPHGHFEEKQVIEMNQRILARQGGDWTNDHAVTSFIDPEDVVAIQTYAEWRSATEPQFGVKDPRLMCTIGTWRLALPSLKALYIHRGFERCCKSLWSRAHADFKAGAATQMNQRLLSSKEDIIALYLNNVATFFNVWAHDTNFQRQTAFINYDDLIAGMIDLRSVLHRLGFDAPGVSPEQYVDRAAIRSVEGFKGRIDPAIVGRARAVDLEIAELCVRQ